MKLIHFPEMFFTVAAEPYIHPDGDMLNVSFKVYEISGCDPDGDNHSYRTHFSREAHSIEEADWLLSGTVKWDGCSNWRFEEGFAHFCSKHQAGNIGRIMEACYDIAADLLGDRCDWREDD